MAAFALQRPAWHGAVARPHDGRAACAPRVGASPYAWVAQSLLSSAALGAQAWAADWPQWRGPNRDGISAETARCLAPRAGRRWPGKYRAWATGARPPQFPTAVFSSKASAESRGHGTTGAFGMHIRDMRVFRQVSLKPGLSSSLQSGVRRPFRPLRPGLSASLRCCGRNLHQPSESRRHGGCTDDRAGSHQPFPASIHLQIQTFQCARTEQLEIARFGENDFVHGLGPIHHKHRVAN